MKRIKIFYLKLIKSIFKIFYRFKRLYEMNYVLKMKPQILKKVIIMNLQFLIRFMTQSSVLKTKPKII
jgi:hypothetical protein